MLISAPEYRSEALGARETGAGELYCAGFDLLRNLVCDLVIDKRIYIDAIATRKSVGESVRVFVVSPKSSIQPSKSSVTKTSSSWRCPVHVLRIREINISVNVGLEHRTRGLAVSPKNE